MSSSTSLPVIPSARRLVAADACVPNSTYRLQLGPELTFADACQQIPHIASLGITHLYLSPILQAAPGSTHGYDVVDHSRISAQLGGSAGFEDFARQARAAGLGLIVDVVPNHMGVPTPAWHNRPLWSVLAQGAASPFANWFDIDWHAGDGAILMPILADRIGDVLAQDQLHLETLAGPTGPTTILRYGEHVFPVRPGTEHLPLVDLVANQHYRLAYWRVANEELNYRRFFDVGALVAVRVEDPQVFHSTHALICQLVQEGFISGLRIDHIDGLADPVGYLDMLADVCGSPWVVIEKILAANEPLSASLRCAGTTGYETAWRLLALHTDPAGERDLAQLMRDMTGDSREDFTALEHAAKREITAGPLAAEVTRLSELAGAVCHVDIRLQDHTPKSLHECLVELLVAADRYRFYAGPEGEACAEAAEALSQAEGIARSQLAPHRHATLDVVCNLLRGREVGSAGHTMRAQREEFRIRFQQVCGAVLAKGIEDTALYRWTPLLSQCEVGSAPTIFTLGPTQIHAWAAFIAATMPFTLTSLTTHDNKRSADTRIALAIASHYPEQFTQLLTDLRTTTASARPSEMDGRIEYALWQTLAATYDGVETLASQRLSGFLLKAMREAKTYTSWTAPVGTYEDAVLAFAAMVRADERVVELLQQWFDLTWNAVWATTLAITALHLTFPGIPDVYQGTEKVRRLLVDPDNRTPVSADRPSHHLAELSAAKSQLVTEILQLRQKLPACFVGPGAGYIPLATTTETLLAFARTDAGKPGVVVLTVRLPAQLERAGGWGNNTVVLPVGTWRDIHTGAQVSSGSHLITELLAAPVAIFERSDD